MKPLTKGMRDYIKGIWKDETWVFIDDNSSMIATLRKNNGDLSHYIEFQKDKYWAKTGGKMCVNYYLVDESYNKYMGFASGTYLDHTRLGHICSGFDEWYNIDADNHKTSLDRIIDDIVQRIIPITERMKNVGEFIRVFSEIGIYQHYAYALYKGERGIAIPMIIERLKNRDKGDLLMKTLVKFGLIGEQEVGRINLIQIQSIDDQIRQIEEFLKEKSWS